MQWNFKTLSQHWKCCYLVMRTQSLFFYLPFPRKLTVYKDGLITPHGERGRSLYWKTDFLQVFLVQGDFSSLFSEPCSESFVGKWVLLHIPPLREKTGHPGALTLKVTWKSKVYTRHVFRWGKVFVPYYTVHQIILNVQNLEILLNCHKCNKQKQWGGWEEKGGRGGREGGGGGEGAAMPGRAMPKTGMSEGRRGLV